MHLVWRTIALMLFPQVFSTPQESLFKFLKDKMISHKNLSQSLASLLCLATVTATLAGQQSAAQQKRDIAPPTKAATKTAQADPPAPTMDALLAADSYKVYGEVKNVGQLVSSGSIAELIDPIMRLASPPKEFTTLVKFLNANAEPLTNARLLFATWPARAEIPKAFFVIELPSPEEAIKFEPKLNRLLPVILPTPTPTASDEKTESPATKPTEPGMLMTRKKDEKPPPPSSVASASPIPAPPPFVVSRSGNLIFVTDNAFKFEKLRPAGTKLLTEDQNFRVAHDRFSTESIFIFFNVALQDKALPKPSPQVISEEQELARINAEEQAIEKAAAETSPEPEAPQPNASPENRNAETTETLTVRRGKPTAVLGSSPAEATPTPSELEQAQTAAFSQLGSLLGLLGGGEPEWPDAVGVAISQETNDYVIRAILIGPQNGKRLVLPFVPQLLAGRSYTPKAPSVLPDDTEILLSASFDLAKTYEAMLGHLELMNKERSAQLRRLPAALHQETDVKPYDPFGEFENKGKFKIKDDLLPALGNEIALAGSLKSLQGVGGFGILPTTPPSPKPSPQSGQTDQAESNKQQEEEGSPILLVSIRDRETARRLMPMVLDGLGIGMAKLIATPVKRDDTEMVDFGGAFAYAFVDDFLVISTTAAVRHLIDSHINHQTLASNNAFRNFTRWQGREMVGQIYVSPALMESYQKAAHDPSQMIAAAMRDYLMRLNPEPQSITYTLSNEGFGAFHELHLPKTLVLATVAGAASATKEPPPEMNEGVAMSQLHMIASAEATYQQTEGKGSYGSLNKLVGAKLLSKEMLDKYGYNIEVTASGNQFEATATPIDYGRTGRRSFFVDQSGIVRGDDHGGAPATVADKQVQ